MYEKIPQLIAKSETISHIGKIENVVGMSMEASGGRSSIGDIFNIFNLSINTHVYYFFRHLDYTASPVLFIHNNKLNIVRQVGKLV